MNFFNNSPKSCFFFLKNYMYTYCRSIISSLLTCSFPVDYKTIGKFMLIFFERNYPWGNELKRVERTIVANTWIYSSIHAYTVRAIKDYQSDQSIVTSFFLNTFLPQFIYFDIFDGFILSFIGTTQGAPEMVTSRAVIVFCVVHHPHPTQSPVTLPRSWC